MALRQSLWVTYLCNLDALALPAGDLVLVCGQVCMASTGQHKVYHCHATHPLRFSTICCNHSIACPLPSECFATMPVQGLLLPP